MFAVDDIISEKISLQEYYSSLSCSIFVSVYILTFTDLYVEKRCLSAIFTDRSGIQTPNSKKIFLLR